MVRGVERREGETTRVRAFRSPPDFRPISERGARAICRDFGPFGRDFGPFAAISGRFTAIYRDSACFRAAANRCATKVSSSPHK